ncbi:MAG: hypothetical protein AAF632_11810 [Bacteroidota bacterium]
MGMFDTLYINTNRLPISRVEKKLLGDNPEWQTKDLDNVLTEVYITDEGELKVNQWEYEEVPKEERPHPDAEGILALAGSLRRVNQRLETIPYHGYIRFYTSVTDHTETRQWYEFSAKFTDGKLVGIKRLEDDCPKYW